MRCRGIANALSLHLSNYSPLKVAVLHKEYCNVEQEPANPSDSFPWYFIPEFIPYAENTLPYRKSLMQIGRAIQLP